MWNLDHTNKKREENDMSVKQGLSGQQWKREGERRG
jgi:hypothetical protein